MWVVFGVGVRHFAVPKGVVGNDETTWCHMWQHHFVVFGILALVGVDKHQIKTLAQPWQNLVGIANVQVNTAAERRLCEMLTEEILQFVLYLDGVKLGIVVEQTFGKALRRIAGECA